MTLYLRIVQRNALADGYLSIANTFLHNIYLHFFLFLFAVQPNTPRSTLRGAIVQRNWLNVYDFPIHTVRSLRG